MRRLLGLAVAGASTEDGVWNTAIDAEVLRKKCSLAMSKQRFIVCNEDAFRKFKTTNGWMS